MAEGGYVQLKIDDTVSVPTTVSYIPSEHDTITLCEPDPPAPPLPTLEALITTRAENALLDRIEQAFKPVRAIVGRAAAGDSFSCDGRIIDALHDLKQQTFERLRGPVVREALATAARQVAVDTAIDTVAGKAP